MDFIEKAKALGEEIKNSEACLNFKKAEDLFNNDELAKELLNEFNELQREVFYLQKEEADEEAIEELKLQLFEKKDELLNYEVSKNYIDLSNDLEKLLKDVINGIKEAVIGVETSGGCSGGGCSGCGCGK